MSIQAIVGGGLDRAALHANMSRAKSRFLVRSGKYIQAVARNSIRVRKRPLTKAERDARVGQTPTSRTRRFKNSIQSGYDDATDSEIIGPVGMESDPSPAAFEGGGIFPITIRTRRGRVRAVGNYRHFPTMGPALQAAAPRLTDFWADSFAS